jgi:20S proteasome alpha/beta subunit
MLFLLYTQGDARALANRLRIIAQRHCLSMGEPCTVREMAQHAANAQHELTRTGGVRPLGCTAIIAGIDSTTTTTTTAMMVKDHDKAQGAATTTTTTTTTTSKSSNDAAGGDVRIFRTNPGGILEDCCYCAAGRNHEDIMNQICKHYNNEKDALLSPTASRSDQLGLLLTLAKKTLGAGSVHDGKDSNINADGATSMDVWMLEPCPWRRGKIKATCVRNLHQGNLDKLIL